MAVAVWILVLLWAPQTMADCPAAFPNDGSTSATRLHYRHTNGGKDCDITLSPSGHSKMSVYIEEQSTAPDDSEIKLKYNGAEFAKYKGTSWTANAVSARSPTLFTTKAKATNYQLAFYAVGLKANMITAVYPNVFGTHTTPEITLTNPDQVFAPTAAGNWYPVEDLLTRVAFVGSGQQCTRAVIAGKQYQGYSSVSKSTSFTLGRPFTSAGTYKICHSKDGGLTWESNAVTVLVIDTPGSGVVTSPAVTNADATASNLDIAFSGQPPKTATSYIAWAPQGRCDEVSLGKTEWAQWKSNDILSPVTVNGEFVLCITVNDVWVEQPAVKLVVTGGNSPREITDIEPNVVGTHYSGRFLLSGPFARTHAKYMMGICDSSTCNNCRSSTALGSMLLSNAARDALSSPGDYAICFTVDGGSNWVWQKYTGLKVVAATTTSITSMYPSIIGINGPASIMFDGPLLTTATRIGFAVTGQCSVNVVEELSFAPSDALENALAMDLSGFRAANTYAVCYSVDGGETYEEQENLQLDVVGYTLFGFSPDYFGQLMPVTMELTGNKYTHTGTFVGFVANAATCEGGSVLSKTRVDGQSEVLLEDTLSVTGLYKVCYSVGGADGDYISTGFTITVLGTTNDVTSISPSTISQSSFATLTLNGLRATSSTSVGFRTGSTDCTAFSAVVPATVGATTIKLTSSLAAGLQTVCVSNGGSWTRQTAPVLNVVEDASAGSISAINGVDSISFPNGGTASITFSGAAPSSLGKIALARNNACNTPALHVDSSNYFTGGAKTFNIDVTEASNVILHVCYSTDNGATYVQQDKVSLEIAVASPTSISFVTPRVVLFSSSPAVLFAGVFPSAATRVAWSQSPTCATTTSVVTVSSASAVVMSAPSVVGTYYICYSVNGGSTYAKQCLVDTKVTDDPGSTTVLSASPNLIGEGTTPSATFTRDTVHAGGQIGFAFAGFCEISRISAIAWPSGTSLTQPYPAFASPARYDICYTDGGSWSLQIGAGVEVTVVGAYPDSVAGVEPSVIGAGIASVSLQFGSVPITATSSVKFTTGACGSGIGQRALTANPLTYTGSLPAGVYDVCYSVGATFSQQSSATLTVVEATASSINALDPAIVGSGTDRFISFGSAPVLASAKIRIDVDNANACTGSGTLAAPVIDYDVGGPKLVTGITSPTAVELAVCYSVNNGASYVKQTVKLGVIVASVTSITALSPSVVGALTSPLLTVTDADVSATTAIAFVGPAGDCSSVADRISVTEVTSNPVSLGSGILTSSTQLLKVCYTVQLGTPGATWVEQALVDLKVIVAGPTSVATIEPTPVGINSAFMLSMYDITMAVITPTPESKIAFAINGACNSDATRLSTTDYTSSGGTAIAALALANVYSLCYTVDNVNWATQTTGTSKLRVINAFATSITAVIPEYIGVGSTAMIAMTGLVATPTSQVSFTLTGDCGDAIGVSNVPADESVDLAGLPAVGTYQVCYSVNGVDFVLQTIPTAVLTVIVAAPDSLSSADPPVFGVNTDTAVSFAGLQPTPDTRVSFVPSSASSCVGAMSETLFANDVATVAGLGGPLTYKVCYSVEPGTFVLQTGVTIDTIAVAATDVTAVTPTRFGVNSQPLLTVTSNPLRTPNTLEISFVPEGINCMPGPQLGISLVTDGTTVLGSPVTSFGVFTVCASFDGVNWVNQAVTVEIVPAGPEDITSITPNVVDKGEIGTFVLEGVEATTTTQLAFALAGQCNTGPLLSVMPYPVAGPITMTEPIENPQTYRICYSVDSGATYSEQTLATLFVQNCAIERDCDRCMTVGGGGLCSWCLGTLRCVAIGGNCTREEDFGVPGANASIAAGESCPTLRISAKSPKKGSYEGGSYVLLDVSPLIPAPPEEFDCLWSESGNVTTTVVNSVTMVSATEVACVSPRAVGQPLWVTVTVRYKGLQYAYASPGENFWGMYGCASTDQCDLCNAVAETQECGFCEDTGTCVTATNCPNLAVYRNETAACPPPPEAIVPVVEPAGVPLGVVVPVSLLALLCCVGIIAIFIFLAIQQKEMTYKPPKLTDAIKEKLIFGSPPKMTADDDAVVKHLEALAQVMVLPGRHALNAIARVTQSTEADKVARAAIIVAESQAEGASTIKEFITREISHCDHQSTLFRTNSFATKMFKTYSKMVGLDYLHKVLGVTLNKEIADNVQIDIKNTDERESSAAMDTFNLLGKCQRVFLSVVKNDQQVPLQFRGLFHHVHTLLQEKFPIEHDDLARVIAEKLEGHFSSTFAAYSSGAQTGEQVNSMQARISDDIHELGKVIGPLQVNLEGFKADVDTLAAEVALMVSSVNDLEGALNPESVQARRLLEEHSKTLNSVAVGGFFFLRFLVPAITAPEAYHLVKENPTTDQRKTLVLIGKVMQNLSNSKEFGSKEKHMAKLNDFIRENAKTIHKFFDTISTVSGAPGESEAYPVPKKYTQASLLYLYNHSKKNFDKIIAYLEEEGLTPQENSSREQTKKMLCHVMDTIAEQSGVGEGGLLNSFRRESVNIAPTEPTLDDKDDEKSLMM